MNEKMILLVEDNPDDEALALRAFRKCNIPNKVQVARDGVEALDYLTRTIPDILDLPTVVLLDLQLPRINGLEVLKRVRENDRTRLLPIVILTSSKEEIDLIQGYSLGANSYIRKPVNFDDFTEVIGTLGRYWLTHNEPPTAN